MCKDERINTPNKIQTTQWATTINLSFRHETFCLPQVLARCFCLLQAADQTRKT